MQSDLAPGKSYRIIGVNRSGRFPESWLDLFGLADSR